MSSSNSSMLGSSSRSLRPKWIKKSRRQLPARRELVATGHLVLPAYASELGTRLDGMEVTWVKGTGMEPGGLRVRAGKSGPVVFLRYEQGRYSPSADGTN